MITMHLLAMDCHRLLHCSVIVCSRNWDSIDFNVFYFDLELSVQAKMLK